MYLQLFAVLFFLMLFVLGMGSAVSLQSAIVTALTDRYKTRKYWQMALAACSVGFLLGLVYVTPVCIYMCFYNTNPFLAQTSISQQRVPYNKKYLNFGFFLNYHVFFNVIFFKISHIYQNITFSKTSHFPRHHIFQNITFSKTSHFPTHHIFQTFKFTF